MKRLVFAAALALLSLPVHAATASGGGEKMGVNGAYLGMEPFVVNIAQGSRLRVMQLKVQVMSSRPQVLDIITAHMPAVRDELIMLFAHQDAAAIATAEGKEALRQQALAALQQVMGRVVNGAGAQTAAMGVEGLYFTDFIIQ